MNEYKLVAWLSLCKSLAVAQIQVGYDSFMLEGGWIYSKFVTTLGYCVVNVLN